MGKVKIFVVIITMLGIAEWLVVPWQLTVLLLCVGLVILLVSGLLDKLAGYFSQVKDKFGQAAFATEKERKRAGLKGNAGLIIGKEKRSLLGRMGGTGNDYIRYNGDGHLMTAAPTRSGKGVGGVVPNLLNEAHKGSIVCVDIKGENWALTKDYRETVGRVYKVYPGHADSHCYNPLDFVRARTEEEAADAGALAEMLVVPQSSDKFWDEEAKALITAMAIFIKRAFKPKYRSLEQIPKLLSLEEAEREKFFEKMAKSKSEVVRCGAISFKQKEPKEQRYVISAVLNHMRVWQDPMLSKVTSGNSNFRMKELKKGRVTLFIGVPPQYRARFQSFLRVMVGLSVAAMTRSQVKPRHNTLFLIDEFPALGYMKPLEDGVAYLAGYGVTLWFFVQDYSQLRAYEKWESMVANCEVQQGFGIADTRTAEYFEKRIGHHTVRTETKSIGRKWRFIPWPWAENYGHSHGETGTELLKAADITRMPEQELLVVIKGMKPMRVEKVKYYKEAAFRRLATPLLEARDLMMAMSSNDEPDDLDYEISMDEPVSENIHMYDISEYRGPDRRKRSAQVLPPPKREQFA